MPNETICNHTPGPWRAQFLNADGVVIRKQGWEITTRKFDVVANIQDGAPIRNEADAYLIAAAPDMLEALKVLDSRGGLGLDMHEYIRLIISRAENSKRRANE